MKNLKDLIEAVKVEGFNFGLSENSFEVFFKEWLKDEEILSYQVSRRKFNVTVVLFNTKQKTYDILRFFPVGEKWNVSVDLQSADLENLVDSLINSKS